LKRLLPYVTLCVFVRRLGSDFAYFAIEIFEPNYASSPSQILLFEKVFSYYEADPKTQKLRLVFQEPYEDGVAFKNQREKK
jgi:hypothetical protein